jgi:serine/threonine protein kinase
MGKLLDSLMFVRELGTGAGTRVSLMRDVRDNKHYCKKSVPAAAENYDSQCRQIKQEFEIGQQVSHPALRQAYEFGTIKKAFRAVETYNVLEYIEGVQLDLFAKTSTTAILTKVFWHVADGLLELHKSGFVHADLKPLNILCRRNGRPTVIDFGQACPMYTKKDRIQGTQDYIAKEQVKKLALDQRTDVFGLGATMHLIYLGRTVETALNTRTVGGSTTVDPNWREAAENLDPALHKLIKDCCAVERENRPQNMQLVKDRLEVAFGRMSKAG